MSVGSVQSHPPEVFLAFLKIGFRLLIQFRRIHGRVFLAFLKAPARDNFRLNPNPFRLKPGDGIENWETTNGTGEASDYSLCHPRPKIEAWVPVTSLDRHSNERGRNPKS